MKVDQAVADPANSKFKIQITAKDAAGVSKNFAVPVVSYVSLTNTSYTKYSIPISSFIEVDNNGDPVLGGASFTNYRSRIVGYLAGFTGNDGVPNPNAVKLDMVAAGGYTPPVSGDITTTIVRAADTVESAVSVSWMYNDGYAGNADVYTVSGAWDAADGVFSTNTAAWTKEFSNVTSPVTDNNQVGKGTQKYYKVVHTGTVLTTDMLTKDVAGKFDLLTKLDKYNFVSVPLVTSTGDINAVLGSQMNQADFEFSADAIYYPNAIGGFDVAWLKTDGKWYVAGSEADLSSINIDPAKSFYILNNNMDGHSDRNVTIVGNVDMSASKQQTVAQLYNMIGQPFPVPTSLTSTGLFESGLKSGDFEFAGSTIYSPNATGGFDIAWLKTDGKWYDAGSDAALSSIKLRPGVGYYLYNTDVDNASPSFSWAYPRPY